MIRKARPIFCLLMLAGLLTGGLWPFNFFCKNSAVWLTQPPGLSFSAYGIAWSHQPLLLQGPGSQPGAITVELWLQPSRYDFGDYAEILSLYRPDRSDWFTICKARQYLFLQGRYVDADHPAGMFRLTVVDALRRDQTDFLTVVAGPSGTYVYRNDELMRGFLGTRPSPLTLGGQLVIGNSPGGHAAWTGKILGLAIYGRELSWPEVARDRQRWEHGQAQGLTAQPGIAAVFPFSEGSGAAIHNLVGGKPGLEMPEWLSPPHREFLDPPTRRSFSHTRDVFLNIVGLMPFGFLVASYSHHNRRQSELRSVLWAMVAGFAVSITIEALQVYLPSRDSSATDLINNVLGSGLGAMVWVAWMRVWARVVAG